jgi:hypothetical protein
MKVLPFRRKNITTSLDEQFALPFRDSEVEARMTPTKLNETIGPKAIQDVLLAEGLAAVKISVVCASIEQLQGALHNRLGQNSLETRKRYSQSIIKWFFQDGIDGLLRNVWCAYGDEAIILDLLRYYYLTNEPLIGACVAESLFPLENGIAVPASYFDKFLSDFLGEPAPEKTRERLKINLKRLGFLERARGKPDRLTSVVPQKTSFLILLHHLFAPRSVRTVEVRNFLTNPFWKYLGYKTEDAVRSLLREADAARVIGKYVAADQLEQVTTCFTYEELLKAKVQL